MVAVLVVVDVILTVESGNVMVFVVFAVAVLVAIDTISMIL